MVPTMYRVLFPAVLLCLAAAVPVAAEDGMSAERRIVVEYRMTWMGLPVYGGTISGRIGEREYLIENEGAARGLMSVFAGGDMVSRVEGVIEKGGYRPRAYWSRSKSRHRARTIAMQYRADRRVAVDITPDPDRTIWPRVPPDSRAGTIDPLTALARAASMGGTPETEPCRWAAPVFDGQRQYRLRFEFVGEEAVPRRTFGGRLPERLIECRVHLERVAGFSRQWLAKHPQPPKPMTIWLAAFSGAGLWLPVRMRTDSPWGTVRGETVALTIE